HRERTAAEVAETIVVIELVFYALRHFLQEQVADVTTEAVVDVAQAIHIERDNDRPRGGTEAADQQLIEALAEQRALREAGQRIEIREELEGVFLLPVLQGERQVRCDL